MSQIEENISAGTPIAEAGKAMNKMGFVERPDLRNEASFIDQSGGQQNRRRIENRHLVQFTRQESKNLSFGRDIWVVAFALDSQGRVTNRYCQIIDIPLKVP